MPKSSPLQNTEKYIHTCARTADIPLISTCQGRSNLWKFWTVSSPLNSLFLLSYSPLFHCSLSPFLFLFLESRQNPVVNLLSTFSFVYKFHSLSTEIPNLNSIQSTDAQLDRIMQSYRLPLDLRTVPPSSSSSSSGRLSPYYSNRDRDTPIISSSRARQVKLCSLWEFLGCWKLVEHERLKRGVY